MDDLKAEQRKWLATATLDEVLANLGIEFTDPVARRNYIISILLDHLK